MELNHLVRDESCLLAWCVKIVNSFSWVFIVAPVNGAFCNSCNSSRQMEEGVAAGQVKCTN